MAIYREMYLTLFRSVTCAIREIESGRGAHALQRLKDAQAQAEEIYISSGIDA